MFNKRNVIFLSSLITTLFIVSMGVEAWAGGVISGTISAPFAKFKKECVVYIDNVAGQWPPTQGAQIDQQGLQFHPIVTAIVVGTTVNFLNHDEVLHNVYSPSNIAENFNLGTWPPGEIKTYTFAKMGCAPLLCNVHTEMEGYVVVLQNPFFAKTDENGNYTIKDIPPGSYILKVWNRNKNLKCDPLNITVQEGNTATADFALKK